MGLTIMTTGVQNYAPGGGGRLKLMLVGGPGVGKTRTSSFWPKPIIADCESGLASIADRQVPYVSVKSSRDMTSFLYEMKLESSKSQQLRRFQTVVIDTADAYERKIKDEWLQQNPTADSFRGFEAWGYLQTKMQQLLTRLLNLDMNVVVNVHYKDKTVTEGSGDAQVQRQLLELQLSGDTKSSIFNDFDFVAWVGTYYEQVDGERVQKRGITFEPSPDRPFLKDRLNIMPRWKELRLDETDYSDLFLAFAGRLDDLPEGQVVGEIGDSTDDGRPMGPVDGGPVTQQPEREAPLDQYDKPTLTKIARDYGLSVKGNTLKSELIQMIRDKRDELARVADEAEAAGQKPADAAPATSADAAPATDSQQPVTAPQTESGASAAPPAETDQTPDASTIAEAAQADSSADEQAPTQQEVSQQEPVATVDEPTDSATVVNTEKGPVETTTGEISEVEAIENLVDGAGATVISQTPNADAPSEAAPAARQESASAPAAEPVQQQAGPGPSATCAKCDKPLADENQDYVRLAWIKYRELLCNNHYMERKQSA